MSTPNLIKVVARQEGAGSFIMAHDRPDLIIDRVDVEACSGCAELARIVVENHDGTRALAFVSVAIINGRPVFSITTKRRDGQETHKKAQASWVI